MHTFDLGAVVAALTLVMGYSLHLMDRVTAFAGKPLIPTLRRKVIIMGDALIACGYGLNIVIILI